MEMVYIKYDPNNNLQTYEDILPNQRENQVKLLTSAFCVTNETHQNFNP